MDKTLIVLALVFSFGLALNLPAAAPASAAPANTVSFYNAAELAILKQYYSEEANKLTVKDFLQGLMGDKNLEVIDKYVHPDYIQHLPSLGDGIEALRELAVAVFPPTAPKTVVEFLRFGADGNLVFVHLKSKRNGNPLSVMHCFRVENALLMEHWEIAAELTPEIAANAKNPHPLF